MNAMFILSVMAVAVVSCTTACTSHHRVTKGISHNWPTNSHINAGKTYKVILPKESFMTIQFEAKGKPGFGIINRGLQAFGSKEVFGWYCEINIKLENTNEFSLPTEAESSLAYNLEDKLSELISGNNQAHPNALFVGHLINQGVMTCMWMVNNPEYANHRLQDYMATDTYPRHFEYAIEKDTTWKNIDHFLHNQ